VAGIQRPRMVAVQADGCAPVIKAFQAHALFCDFWIGAHTLASGLRVPKSFADQLIMNALYESHGSAVDVSDEAIINAQIQLAKMEGIFAAPEGAATLAGLEKLMDQGWIDPDEKIVLFNTGTGLKYLKHGLQSDEA
jgi:threonine synthase